ncbi:GNAT family N-acetyltransferase [Rhodosalinus sp. 5P4]|uniref:GNAT family N-acetyltransferase n=1 Tax=Rhodosalinus sp. 5P4 TaxID=3239196 RepID=UPI0035258BC7
MEFSADSTDRAEEIIALFESTFGASEGAEEGRLIGTLVKNLLETTKDEDLAVFTAREGGVLAGAIIFSRLAYDEDARIVFLLAPVAVETGRQGQGIGQALLNHGLAAMRDRGADVAITYGDPAYYGKVGFAPIGEDTAAPPHPLQQPEGWLAQNLTTRPLDPLKGRARCVPAFDDPAYW